MNPARDDPQADASFSFLPHPDRLEYGDYHIDYSLMFTNKTSNF